MAFTTCMCRLRPIYRRFSSSSLKFRNKIDFDYLTRKHGDFTIVTQNSLGIQAFPVYKISTFSNGLFAAAKREDDSSQINGLAEQILKERIAADEKSSDGDESSKKSKEEEERRAKSNKITKYTVLFLGALIVGGICCEVYFWGPPLLDENGQPIKDEFSDLPIWLAYLRRAYKEARNYSKSYEDPSCEKLLPEPLTDPYYQPPYTLAMEMNGVLVHPEWTYQTGWRFKKRPGVEFFLQQVSTPLYEIVIYTSEQGFTAFPIIDILDPHGYIMYRLFRDATRYMDKHHVKDLSCLNRDLSKVIFLDWDDKSFQLQPENAFKLKRWMGDDTDRTLIDLAIFLRMIATSGVEDVRTVLDFYRQFDDPLEAFKENQKKLQEEEQRKQMENDKHSLTSSWSSGLYKRR